MKCVDSNDIYVAITKEQTARRQACREGGLTGVNAPPLELEEKSESQFYCATIISAV